LPICRGLWKNIAKFITYTVWALTQKDRPRAIPNKPLEACSVLGLDDSDRDSMQRESPRTLKKIDNGEQLSTDDVKKMTKAGLSDNVIVDQIHSTHSVFYLSTADIIDLKNAGVSQKVIDAMIQSGT